MVHRAALRCVLLLALGGMACQPVSTPPAESGFLRLADKDDIPTLDPALGYDTASWQFIDGLFDTLLDYDESGKLVGEIATSWEVAADGRLHEFRLSAAARFSDGQPVEAADVKYALERVLDPVTRSPGAEFFRGIEGAEDCRRGDCRVAGIEVVDRQRLRIRLVHPDPLFLHKMALPFASPVPSWVVAERGQDFGRHPVGSGPFRLREWRPGERLVLERRQDYGGPEPPRVAGVIRFVGLETDLAWLRFRAGELDVTPIPAAEYPGVMRSPELAARVRSVLPLRTQYVGMNVTRAPFDDARVRRAMNLAVRRDKLRRLLNDRATEAWGFVPPHLPGYDSPAEPIPHDPVEARRLLAEAGHASGFTTTLWLRNDESALRIAQSLQQDLAMVGISLQLKPLAWGPFLEAVKRGEKVPMFLLGWEADFPDPANFLEVLLHSRQIGSNNDTAFSDSEVDRLLDAAAASAEPSARRQFLRQAEQRALAAAPWVPLLHPRNQVIVHPRVRDLELHPLRPFRFRRVWLAEEGAEPETAIGEGSGLVGREPRPPS